MRRDVWQGIGLGAVIALLILIIAAFTVALRGPLAGIVVAVICLLATAGGLARWMWLERSERRERPVVVPAVSEFAQESPGWDWGFDPDQPPAHRFDPKIVIAAVETSRLGHVWKAPISTHEVHAAAWRCERQGQLPAQIARTFELESWQVEHLLSYDDPDDALAVNR